MADDRKRSNEVKIRLTDRELLALTRLAAMEDRPLGEMAWKVVRRVMFGIVPANEGGGDSSFSPDEGLR